MGTLTFENYWVNPKTDLVDPHRTKNGQNAPSWSGVNTKLLDGFLSSTLSTISLQISKCVCLFFRVHEGAFYQLFFRLSSAISFEPIFGNIDVPLGIY